MNQTNVIITSGSKNQIIHVPVVTSTTRAVTPIDIVTSSSSTTVRSNYQNIEVRHSNSEHNSVNNGNNNNSVIYSPINRFNRSPQTSVVKRNVGNNRRDMLFNNEDNSEIKTLYFNRDAIESREHLLLPTEAFIKEELEAEEYEEYESMDETDLEGIASAKTQFKCSGCGKGFCYTGWLDRHKLASPACRNAQAIKESYVVNKGSTNTSTNSSNKLRPSLEGRHDELLCCPNQNCTFVTHWVQSLNKHVFSSCKFGKDSNNSYDISSSNSTAKKVGSLQVCHLCNQSFDDTEQHIQHMKNLHQIKLIYQCSECKINFETKSESEAHIAEHNRFDKSSAKVFVSTPISGKPDNKSQQQNWLCDICDKSYLSERSYEIHRTSCENALNSSVTTSKTMSRHLQTAPIVAQKQASQSGQSGTDDKTIRHFKREQIEAIHIINFNCRDCKKPFDTSYGLCNHLSRRPTCREWYYKNLPLELEKNNSLHLMEKSPTKRMRFEFIDGFSSDLQSSPNRKSTDGSSNSSPTRPSKASIGNRRKSGENNSHTNSARCGRCRKVFVGKNPTVALTNHLRGATCNPNKYSPFQKPQIVKSRIFQSSSARVVKKILNSNNQNRMPASLGGESRFYCKLCPRIELKNRVSLGCHLTIYHGLPQVNVTTGEGDAFRCQNCQQVFSSKYFYNLHRQDCDLTSPYIGIVSDTENVRQNNFQKNSSFNDLPQKRKPNTSAGIRCGLCGKYGFSNNNLLNIHQKYQCVKRHQSSKAQPNLNSIVNTPSISGFKPQPEGQVKVANAELARLNDRAKNEPKLTMCDQCGKGPYNSYYYFIEHKKRFCMAFKGKNDSIDVPNKAKKSFGADTQGNGFSTRINESFCLNPTIPRARKTMNFANVASPQVSIDSSAPMEANPEESVVNEEVVSITKETKCSVCFVEFDDILKFIRHRLSHISHNIMQNDSIDTLDCELCGARVHHYQRIQQHLILHLQNVQILKKRNLIEVNKNTIRHTQEDSDDEDQDLVLHCPYCKSEYKSRVELAEHIKKTCPFRYQCPDCNNTYMTKESFSEHREECSKNMAINKTASKAPTYKCKNCGLEFRIKQQLLCHEMACTKVYGADHSGRVDEVIERSLSCSVCGLVSDLYERKVKHESKCLNRYLAIIGNCIEEIKSDCEDIVCKRLSDLDFDLTSLSNTSESSEVPEKLIKDLKQEFGIQKEVKVVLTPFDEEIVRKLKNDLYCQTEESVQFEALKESFVALARRLIKNDSVLHQMSQDSSAQVLLSRMLKYLGEEVIEHNGLNELNCFRQNLQTFLKLTIRDDTLILAYREAESVDEAIINMLNFECELHC